MALITIDYQKLEIRTLIIQLLPETVKIKSTVLPEQVIPQRFCVVHSLENYGWCWF